MHYTAIKNLYDGNLPFTETEFNTYLTTIEDCIKKPEKINQVSNTDSERMIELITYLSKSGINYLNSEMALFIPVIGVFLSPISLAVPLISLPATIITTYAIKKVTEKKLSDYEGLAKFLRENQVTKAHD